MTTLLVRSLKKAISLVPLSVSTFVYKAIPRPLQNLANRIIRSGIPESIKIPEGTLALNQADPAVSGMLAMGAYEPFETEFFRNQIKPGMTILDIGANIGFYTVIAASKVGTKGKIIAYEPEPTNFLFLSKNVAINNFTNVTLVKEGVSDKAGEQYFYLTPDNKGTHSLIDNRGTRDSITITTNTLDNSLRKLGSPKIDLIKMDIEGIEIIALDGMKEAFSENPGLILITEIYPQAIRRLGRQPIEYLNKLTELGFSLSSIDEDKKGLVPLLPADFEAFINSFPKGEVAKNLYAKRE